VKNFLALTLTFCALSFLLGSALPLLADEGRSTVVTARWIKRDGQLTLSVPLTEQLSAKQKSLIESGFSTYSQLLIRQPATKGSASKEAQEIYRLTCSVKFDAWEERYDVVRLDGLPEAAIVKESSDYAELCLTARLEDAARLAPLRAGMSVIATLFVQQASQEEAKRVKEWLIQQQSGVIQGLFSHMLRELTLSERIDVLVKIPPFTEDVGLKN